MIDCTFSDIITKRGTEVNRISADRLSDNLPEYADNSGDDIMTDVKDTKDMKRKIFERLAAWKNKKTRKPLILWGARQVGKTWTLRKFGKEHFPNVVYISFYNNSRIAEIFEKDYDTDRIITALEVELHTTINSEDTLMIFDEIQGAPKVLESLKYFCEEKREYAICAAGSLLGVALHEGVSFPVGKVDELHLYPMSFQEFLMAAGEERLADLLENGDFERINDFSARYTDLLKQYYVVGGMPEVVGNFVQDRDYEEARGIQNDILNQYEGDFGKHVKAEELPRIRMVWNSLPAQLSKENKKFFFGQIKKGARSKDYEIALQWLADAGLIYKVNKVTKPAMPLKSYADMTAFKVYMNDVGLLGAMSELDPESIITGNDIFTEFKGALTEQYVLQQMICETEYTPYYYSSEKSAYEVDFLIQSGKNVIPVEVKAEVNLKAKSLKYYYDKFDPAYALRISMLPYKEQDWLVNVPLWGVQNIK